jgi:two-component system sensor histidine kinase KdpD
VDVPPEDRNERSAEQQVDAAKRAQQLSRLRELALVLAADVVDHQLSQYLERNCISQHFGTQERILVCITPRANIHEMMETALTIATRFHGELIVGYVNQPHLSPESRTALEEKLMIARAAGAHVEILEGEDPATSLLEFARSRGVTQLFVGHSQRSDWKTRIWGSPIDKLIRRARGIDVRVFPHEVELR